MGEEEGGGRFKTHQKSHQNQNLLLLLQEARMLMLKRLGPVLVFVQLVVVAVGSVQLV